MVAERGMSLSGGQKQRISISRAVLKAAEILIFDDSTSALDLKTEADLYAALKQANPESTKLIIAQRSASRRCAGPTGSWCWRTAPSPPAAPMRN